MILSCLVRKKKKVFGRKICPECLFEFETTGNQKCPCCGYIQQGRRHSYVPHEKQRIIGPLCEPKFKNHNPDIDVLFGFFDVLR
jgi:hypothetical protein